MPFLGTTPTQGFVGANPKQSFTANGSTTVFTLTHPVASANDLEVFVGNVRQEPTAAYSAAGTTLTMTEAPDTGLNFYVINKSQAQVTTTPPVNSISTDKIVNSAVTDAKIGAMAASKLTGTVAGARMPTGSVIQFKETAVTSAISLPTATGQYHAVPSVNVSITPSATTSKIFIMVKLELGHPPIGNTSFQLMRDSTAVGIGDASSNAQRASFSMAQRTHSAYEVQQINHHFLDSPSTTSAITYSLRFWNNYSTSQMYLGRTHNSITTADDEMYPSIITAMEIAG